MKRIVFLCVMMCAFLVFASTGWALTIDGGSIDVGELDPYIDSTILSNYGDKTELNWINDTLTTEEDFTLSEFHKIDGSITYYAVDESTDTWAFQLTYTPAFFAVKFGNGSGTSAEKFDAIALYQNVSSLDWGVIQLTGDIKSIEAYSHRAEVGAAPVPEPSTILLLGLGLVGIAGIGRKKIKR